MAEVLTSPEVEGNITTNVIGGWAANDAESALSTAEAYRRTRIAGDQCVRREQSRRSLRLGLYDDQWRSMFRRRRDGLYQSE